MQLHLVRGTVFAFLIGLGTAGNIFVCMSYALMSAGTDRNSVHLILTHLSFTHIIMLLSQGVQKIATAFVLRNFLDDTGCKVAIFLHRVARGLSICTTGLLTLVQAITTSPKHSGWRKLQPRSALVLLPLLVSFWILNSAIGMNLLYYIKSTNTSKFASSDDKCDFQPQNLHIRWLFLALMVLRDAVLQGLMGGASVYIVLVLHKHHQRVLHLQGSKFLYTAPPEIKAARSVLLLMLCFLFSYWIEYMLTLFLNSLLGNNAIVFNIRELLTMVYPILSPFLLIHRDGHLRGCRRDYLKKLFV